jgi:hypothetical protein
MTMASGAASRKSECRISISFRLGDAFGFRPEEGEFRVFRLLSGIVPRFPPDRIALPVGLLTAEHIQNQEMPHLPGSRTACPSPDQTEQDAGAGGQDHRERQHGGVDPDLLDRRKVRRC